MHVGWGFGKPGMPWQHHWSCVQVVEPHAVPTPQPPVTTGSQPWPHIVELAHPIAGLWQAIPVPPSGYVHE
jgi:hypothetical protein